MADKPEIRYLENAIPQTYADGVVSSRDGIGNLRLDFLVADPSHLEKYVVVQRVVLDPDPYGDLIKNLENWYTPPTS